MRVVHTNVLTDTPMTTICQLVDRLANRALFTVRLTELPIACGLSLDQPVHQSIAASFKRTTNMLLWERLVPNKLNMQ